MNDSLVISLKFRQYLEDKILENYILNESSQSYLYSNIPQKFFKIRFASWNSPYGATPQFFTLIIPQLFQARSVYQNETKTSLVAQRCCAAPSWREIRGSFSIKEFLWRIQRLCTVDRFANIVQFQRESTLFAPVPQLFEGKHDCQLCDHEAND